MSSLSIATVAGCCARDGAAKVSAPAAAASCLVSPMASVRRSNAYASHLSFAFWATGLDTRILMRRLTPMITEIAQIDVKPGTEKDFEAAVAKARPLFLRARGGKGFELHKSIEKPQRYRLMALAVPRISFRLWLKMAP